MADTRTLKLSLLADVQKFLAGMDKAEKETKNFSSSVGKYSKAMAASFAVAGAAAGAYAVKIGVDAVKAASDLSEEISKSNIIFGDQAKAIEQFSESAEQSLGLTKKEALGSAATFAILGKNAGLTGKDLTKFSKTSVTLAADLGSFYNTKAEDAIAAIGSAMRGEAEPIRKYGVLISAAALDQAALNYENRTGEPLERDKKNQLTESAKVLARYQAILDQTKDAQGDFSRTSDGLAAQQKILNAQLENLKTTMGESLLPVMKNVVTQANFVAKAFAGNDAESLSDRARELAGTYDGQGAGGYNLGLALKNLAASFSSLFSALNSPNADESANALQTFANALNSVAKAINAVGSAYKSAKSFTTKLLDTFNIGDENAGFASGIPGLPNTFRSRAAGGSVMAGGAYRVGEFGPELFVPSGSGSIRQDNGGGGVVINLNGIVDAESARRSIERLLQNSTRRTGPLNLAGSQL
jgi:hypothetical protein